MINVVIFMSIDSVGHFLGIRQRMRYDSDRESMKRTKISLPAKAKHTVVAMVAIL